VTEVGNPTNTRIVWLNDGPTMTDTIGNPTTNIGESAGWGRYSADISDFAGKVVQVTFHLDSDTSVNLSGWAIDDVQIYNISPVAANVGVSGRVADAKGNAISRAIVTLTGSNGVTRSVKTNTFGYYRFDNVEVGDTYILNAERKGYLFSPRVVSVQEEIADADLIAIE
jgi:bacillopeptidase F (M6 metalloprotease family)